MAIIGLSQLDFFTVGAHLVQTRHKVSFGGPIISTGVNKLYTRSDKGCVGHPTLFFGSGRTKFTLFKLLLIPERFEENKNKCNF